MSSNVFCGSHYIGMEWWNLVNTFNLVTEFSQFLNSSDDTKTTDSVSADSAVHLSGNSTFAESTDC